MTGRQADRQTDNSISFIRLIAMVLIVSCHFLQYYGNELAWWFNVGVQIFLFISGYLYGNRVIVDPLEFYKKQFLKVLIPYYILISIGCFIGRLFDADIFTWSSIFKLLVLHGSGEILALAHMWYIPYILMCYLITPLLLNISNKVGQSKNWQFKIVLTTLGIIAFYELFVPYFLSAWIISYWFGVLYSGVIEKSSWSKVIDMGCILTSAVAVTTQLLFDYVFKIEAIGIVHLIYGRICNYIHVLLAVSLFILLRKLYKNFKGNNQHVLLNYSDRYSYYIYLTHQVFILGSFSICSVITNKFLAVIVSLIFIVISTMFLVAINKKCLFFLERCTRKIKD